MEREIRCVLLFLIGGFVIANARVIEKRRENITSTTESEPVKINQYTRNARQDLGNQASSVTQPPATAEEQSFTRIYHREVRASAIHEINATGEAVQPTQALIKAPIPKFYELNYDNEFDGHQEKIRLRHISVDSGFDHEDEDFNVHDYDFDVKHDEFLGRNKPVEPRVLEGVVGIASGPEIVEDLATVASYRGPVKEYPFVSYKPGLESD